MRPLAVPLGVAHPSRRPERDSRPERARLRELGVEGLILVTRADPRRIENAARVLNVTVG